MGAGDWTIMTRPHTDAELLFAIEYRKWLIKTPREDGRERQQPRAVAFGIEYEIGEAIARQCNIERDAEVRQKIQKANQ